VRAREARRDDGGFTLIETLVVLAIGGIMLGITAWAYRSYQVRHDHRGAAAQSVSTLRNAQSRALSEARTYCVRFDATAKTTRLYRYSCDTASGGEAVAEAVDLPRGVKLNSAAFTRPDGTVSADAYFYPRGSASGGSVVIGHAATSRTYTVTVEGLTARVSSNA